MQRTQSLNLLFLPVAIQFIKAGKYSTFIEVLI